jgi:hypothetical protein
MGCKANPDVSHGRQIGAAGWECQWGLGTIIEILAGRTGRDLDFRLKRAWKGSFCGAAL